MTDSLLPMPVISVPTAIRVNEQSVRKLRMGYPWVFRSEVINAKAAENIPPGTVVDFVRDKGDFVARGFYNPKPQLVGRILTLKQEEKIEKFFIYHFIENAVVYRDKLFGQPYYRLIHAESDGLPGLIVDRFGDVIVAQVNTAGMEMLWPHVESALKPLLKPRAIVLRNDSNAREVEGLEKYVKVIHGELADKLVEVHDGAAKFYANVLEGQKTGWFYDQRENRRWVSQLTRDGTLLDVFCHTGGFGIMAARNGAQNVTFVDSSSDALIMVDKNAELNDVAGKCSVTEGVAFDVMEKLAHLGRKYDVVCVDPPAFIKSRKDMGPGMKGYQKLARLAIPLVERAGFLFFASCSHHADTAELIHTVSGALQKSGRPFQLIKVAGASADHPVHPMLPETGYLKALTFRFLD
ncbi:MAG TPA: class I SAM-dependent rRNA methyltransferase [Patescibacteria group bacterium]|nr:class I SAM-dependent rRNA methyltransferase [Patescibacteria group bacterium]